MKIVYKFQRGSMHKLDVKMKVEKLADVMSYKKNFLSSGTLLIHLRCTVISQKLIIKKHSIKSALIS